MSVKPFWLALAVGGLALTLRWKGLGRFSRALLALATIGLALVGVGIVDIPSIDQLVKDVGTRLGRWTYLLVGLSAFLETGAFLGFVAPGETMVLFAGVLAGAGTIELVPLILIVWGSAALGDIGSYWIGRRFGRGFLLKYGARVKVGEAQVRFVERFFERHGFSTVFFGRWVGVVRPLVPFLAGQSRLPFARFLVVDLAAAGLWAAALAVLGSVFWRNFDQLSTLVGQVLVLVGVVIVGSVLIGTGLAARRSERRSAQVEAWLAAKADEHSVLARPAALAWALVGWLDRLLPHRGARRAPTAAAGTVGAPPGDDPPAPTDEAPRR